MAKLDELVKEFLSGNANAFDLIYEETKHSVYLSIYSIIQNRSTIDDLMQDTYLKALDSISSYKLGSNFKAWISKIAHNNAINHYNKYSKVTMLDDEHVELISANDSTPLIDSALEILDGKEKDIFIYRIVLDYKFKDIANILDINLKTAFYLYKKAINKIKIKENL